MSVDIKIVNRGIFKKKLSMHDFLETGLQVGVMDSAWRMQPLETEAADDFILYDPACIARGIQVVWKQPYEVELYLLLPTCHQEIEAFYALIQHLCNAGKRVPLNRMGKCRSCEAFQTVSRALSRSVTSVWTPF